MILSLQAQSTSSNCLADTEESVSRWFGDSMITSCAPMPLILSYTPSPALARSPSILSAGYLFGTTLICQPDVLVLSPFVWYAIISLGVIFSLPGQNGHSPPFYGGGVTTNSDGRFPRSVAIITHLPIMGSFLSSGISKKKKPIKNRFALCKSDSV